MLDKLDNVYNTIGEAQAELERVNHKLGRLTAAWRSEADEFGHGTPPEVQPTLEEMGGLYSFADLLASHTEALKHEVGRFAEYVSAYNGLRLDMGVKAAR